MLKLTVGQQHSHTHHHQLRGDANTYTNWKHKGKTFIAMFTSLSTLGSLEKDTQLTLGNWYYADGGRHDIFELKVVFLS